MLAVGIGLFVYIIVVISLCVSFVLSVLINSKKIGFLKAVKSKASITILVWIFICGVLPTLLFIPRSGNRLFKDFIINPIPKSVKVIDSYDGAPNFDAGNCLHFTISPDDFQLILASKNWEAVTEEPFPYGVECSPSPWPPLSLGDNVIIYSYVPIENEVEVMFTNSQMSEVYFYYFDGNLP